MNPTELEIETYLSKVMKLVGKGPQRMGQCPQASDHAHGDRNPSCSVNVERGLLLCHGCGLEGNIEGLWRKLNWPCPYWLNGYRDTADQKPKPWERIWAFTLLIRKGQPAWRYIRETRGIAIEEFPNDVRFHLNLNYYKDKRKVGTHPAIVAIVRGAKRDARGIHRIYLTQAGGKARVPICKMSLGKVGGGAIYLGESGPVLNVAEGLETSLAISSATKFFTCAAVSTSGMKALEIPPQVKTLNIWADHDLSKIGEKSALELAARAHTQKLTVFLLVPPGPIPDGKNSRDWLDVYNQEGPEALQLEIERGAPWAPAQKRQSEKTHHGDGGGAQLQSSEQLARLIKDLCPAAKQSVPENLVLPPGYSIHENEIKMSNGGLLTQTPVFIVSEKVRLDDATRSIEVVIIEDGNPRTLEEDAEVFFEQKKIVSALQRRGIDSNSKQARDLVDYFVAFKRENRRNIPKSFVTESFGLKQENGRSAYLLGATCTGDFPVSFQAALKRDEGIRQAFEPRGSLEGWKEGFQKFCGADTVLFTLFFALTPPLHGLGILPFINSTLHLHSQTSQGKTMCQRIAISMMGNPESDLLGQWNSTFTGAEEHILKFQALPVFLEDSQQAATSDDRQKIVYFIGNGSGKLRSSAWKKHTDPYKGALISSGEFPLKDERSAGGMSARLIELEGSPFGRTDVGQLVDEVHSIIRENYGHVYLRYIEHLMSLDDRQREKISEQFEQRTRHYETLAQGNGILARRSPVFAADEITGQILLAEILKVTDIDPVSVVERIFLRVKNEDAAVHRAKDAMHQILTWCFLNQDSFANRVRIDGKDVFRAKAAHSGPTFGLIAIADDFVAVQKSKVDELLQRNKLDSDSILTEWRGKGWIQVTDRRRFTRQIRMGDRTRIHLIKILNLHKWTKVGEPPEPGE